MYTITVAQPFCIFDAYSRAMAQTRCYLVGLVAFGCSGLYKVRCMHVIVELYSAIKHCDASAILLHDRFDEPCAPYRVCENHQCEACCMTVGRPFRVPERHPSQKSAPDIAILPVKPVVALTMSMHPCSVPPDPDVKKNVQTYQIVRPPPCVPCVAGLVAGTSQLD